LAKPRREPATGTGAQMPVRHSKFLTPGQDDPAEDDRVTQDISTLITAQIDRDRTAHQ